MQLMWSLSIQRLEYLPQMNAGWEAKKKPAATTAKETPLEARLIESKRSAEVRVVIFIFIDVGACVGLLTDDSKTTKQLADYSFGGPKIMSI